MSDDPQNPGTLIQLLSQGSMGWFFAAITGTWGIVLRVLIGRYIAKSDEQHRINVDIDRRLALIEGRLIERDRNV